MAGAARGKSYSKATSEIERTYYGSLIRSLVARRTAKGLTQEQLDQQLGVSDGQVAKWETFLRLPGAFMLMCWAQHLDLDMIAVLRQQEGDASS